MPDWNYRTLLRPALFRLSGETSRRFVVAALGRLSRTPGGVGLVDFLGHMKPPAQLRRAVSHPAAVGPVGLSSLVDPEAYASAALSRFGAGFLEVGPVLAQAAASPNWTRNVADRSLRASGQGTTSLRTLLANLRAAPPSVPLWVRVTVDTPPETFAALADHAAAFVLDAADAPAQVASQFDRARAGLPRESAPRLLLSVQAGHAALLELSRAAAAAGADGIVLRGEQSADDGDRLFAPDLAPMLGAVHRLRAELPDHVVIAAGGVYEPDDARLLLEAGAQLTLVEAGMVFAGPGLLKRCNEALSLAALPLPAMELAPLSLEAARHAWFWALVMGVAMLLGGLMTFVIASTRVVLPYDEALCGLNRAQLMEVNPRLLPFMAHDRVSLAGSMLSIGVLYMALGWHGLRRGAHWAQVTVLLSALTGFASMFLFLGFGYFDPLHAFVTSVLFQFLLLCSFAPLGEPAPIPCPEWREGPAFRRAQWGQLIFVLLGTGLLLAGIAISFVGITSVFVAEDLEFMRTTAAELGAAHERLVSLVAHDRATFGGMLIANGIAVLLSALWGFRAGAAWLWRALAWSGNLAFAAAIGVHYVVGYGSWFHLAPAFLGWALWLLGLGLCRAWLVNVPAAA